MHKAKVGVLISGRGSNMAALLYAAKADDCPYEIVLVAANDPQAPGLTLAAAEGIPIFGQSHKGHKRAEFDQTIDAQLSNWNLSVSEKEVAFLLLKGMSLKELAEIRKTTEKTARAQSIAIYSKAGLAGRSELSAFFLEDLLPPSGNSSAAV